MDKRIQAVAELTLSSATAMYFFDSVKEYRNTFLFLFSFCK